MRALFNLMIDDLRKTYIIKTLTVNKRREIDCFTVLSDESKLILTTNELMLYLEEKDIPIKYYAIGVVEEDKICILKDEVWLVFYSERGKRRILFSSNKEKEACQSFLLILKKTIATDTNRKSINLYKNL